MKIAPRAYTEKLYWGGIVMIISALALAPRNLEPDSRFTVWILLGASSVIISIFLSWHRKKQSSKAVSSANLKELLKK